MYYSLSFETPDADVIKYVRDNLSDIDVLFSEKKHSISEIMDALYVLDDECLQFVDFERIAEWADNDFYTMGLWDFVDHVKESVKEAQNRTALQMN